MKSDNNGEKITDLLVFTTGERYFAVHTDRVAEISPVVPVTPAPFTDRFVSGLVSVSGQILPQIHLGALLGDTQADDNYGELLVIRGDSAPCTIAVDKVLEKLSVPEGDISGVDAPEHGDDLPGQNLVKGEFRWQDTAVIILGARDIAALVLGTEPDEGESAFLAPAQTREEESGTYREPCLKLLIGKEAYVLPMKEAVEIIRAEDFSPVPGTPGFIKGLTLVREQSLLVVSGGTLLGLGDLPEHDIVVVNLEGMRIGVSVTAVDSALSVSDDDIRRFSDPESRLAGVVHGDADTISGLLSVESLLTRNERQAVAAHTPQHRRITGQERIVINRSVLEVVQSNQHFGIPVDSVERIIDYQLPRPLPSDNPLITGAIEYESRVLPVLSGDLLCSLDGADAQTAYVVLTDGRQRQWALPVQQANRIRDIDEATIKPLEKRQKSLIREVAQFEGRLLSMFNPAALADFSRPDMRQETDS